MLLWFDKNGVLKEILDYGPTAKAGSHNFQIFAYFDIGDNYTDVYGSATIRYQRPDLEKSEYPTLMMTKASIVFDKTITDAGINYSGNFIHGNTYIGYIFDFSKIQDTSLQSVVTLLDMPGLWETTITLINNNSGIGINNVVGLITFNVEGSVISEDDEATELSYNVLLDNTATAIAAKLDKDSEAYVRFHDDFITAADSGLLAKSIFVVGSYVLNKKTNKIYRITEISENAGQPGFVYAKYEVTTLDGGSGLNVVTIEITPFDLTQTTTTELSAETVSKIVLNPSQVFRVQETGRSEYLYFWLNKEVSTKDRFVWNCFYDYSFIFYYKLRLDKDSNELIGSAMQLATSNDLEKVKNSVEDLSNTLLNNYYDKTSINSLLETLKKNTYQVVDELPDISEAEEGVIYLIPNQSKENVYEQYTKENDSWLYLGSTSVDLTDYYTKEEINTIKTDLQSEIALKQNKLNAGNGLEINNDTDTISSIIVGMDISIDIK